MASAKEQRRLGTSFGLAGIGFACVLTLLSLDSIQGDLELALRRFAIAIPASIGAGMLASIDQELRHPLTKKAILVPYYFLGLLGMLGNLAGIKLLFQHMSPTAGEYLINCVGVIFLVVFMLDKLDDVLTLNKNRANQPRP